MIQSIELLKSLRFLGPHIDLKQSSVLVLGEKVWSFWGLTGGGFEKKMRLIVN